MGRRGEGVLQSDAALDFFDAFIHDVHKEIAYWVSRLRFKDMDRDIASDILAPVDLLAAILEHYDYALIVGQPTIQSYQDAFLAAWDKDVADSTERERLIITALFERLKFLEYGYDGTSDSKEREQLRAAQPPREIQGTFKELLDLNEREWSYGRLPEWVIDKLRKELIYWFSPQMCKELRSEYGTDQFVTAADLLAFICEYYGHGPELRAKTVQHWRRLVIRYCGKAAGEPFDKLAAVAEKYPPFEP